MIRKISMIFSLILLGISADAKDSTSSGIMKQVDYLQKKHEILASNIANANTPKYTAKDVEAPESISRNKRKVRAPRVKLKVTNAKHLKPVKAYSDRYNIINDNSGEMKPNKNNVDLAKQVSKAAVNSDEVAIALKNYKSSMDLIANAADPGGHR